MQFRGRLCAFLVLVIALVGVGPLSPSATALGELPITFVVQIDNPALSGGRWLLSTTRAPDSNVAVILGSGTIGPGEVLSMTTDLAGKVATQEDRSTQFNLFMMKPLQMDNDVIVLNGPGNGLLAVASIGLQQDQILSGDQVDFGSPTIKLVPTWGSPEEAWAGSSCGALTVEKCGQRRVPARPNPEMPDMLEYPTPVFVDDPIAGPDPSGNDEILPRLPEAAKVVTVPPEICTLEGECGSQGAAFHSIAADCDYGVGYSDCITDSYLIPGVRAFRGWSGRVAGSTNVFSHESTATREWMSGVRSDAGPFEASLGTRVTNSSGTKVTWPMRGDCWKDSGRDVHPCSSDGSEGKFGRDTWKWEKHLTTYCYDIYYCSTYVSEVLHAYSMDGGSETPFKAVPTNYYRHPWEVRYGYYGSWGSYQPGSTVETHFAHEEWWDNSARIKVDFPESFGSTEYSSSMADETEDRTTNTYELRDLPWISRYTHYDGGISKRWWMEFWTCEWNRGWHAPGPCYNKNG